MRYIIDRFEGNLAVCENEKREMLPIKKEMLPADAKVGDIIEEESGSYTLKPEATAARRKTVQKKMTDLFE